MENFELKLSIEKSKKGKRAVHFGEVKNFNDIDKKYLREKEPNLPQMSEFDVVRHFTRMSKLNFSIDTHFYPLGSCTMKYNPKINEETSSFEGFTSLHPLTLEQNAQGTLEIIYDIKEKLCEICGMDDGSMWPVAGAHGEFTGILIAKKYFDVKGEKRDEIIVPDSAHGTNPATATMAGFKTISICSTPDGKIDINTLKQHINKKTAVIMLTIPNTLGIFETQIEEIVKICHDNGTLVYMDGANMNALIGLVKPGDFDVDILHLNLHKTFSTPHGGGGPGSGAVLVKKFLSEYLPIPIIIKKNNNFELDENRPNSIGRIKAFFTNTQVLLRAYTYLLMHDFKKLREISENAIINSNYVKSKLERYYPAYSKGFCMHECVLTPPKEVLEKGVKTIDIAKRLLDLGFHAPTIYFPLIVQEAIMIEPTETENKDTLDEFINAMIKIYHEAINETEKVKNAPHNMPVKRLDEVTAARKPNLRW
ncbi:MAG: aminomethyl-transferring glycine dehydrogenase subunit GcvPB [Elusimicrobiales bacterium]|nr:aminomethyl-transferring glycine dehydrogenase subunit GcvPB [Elusimicrobiales bacterium]